VTTQPAPPAFTIRRARVEDAPGICAAHVASIRGVCFRDYTPEQIEAWCVGKRPEIYTERMTGKAMWYVAEDLTGIGGFGDVDIAFKPGWAEVRGLYLAPAFIGRGAGKALMDRMLADARTAGAARVYVKSTLTAEPFYARCGFLTTGRTTHRTRTGQEIPSVEMELALARAKG
jgi:putative acetyltransferase